MCASGVVVLNALYLANGALALNNTRSTCFGFPKSTLSDLLPQSVDLDSQIAGNNRPLYPQVDRSWFKVAHNYEPLALQGHTTLSRN